MKRLKERYILYNLSYIIELNMRAQREQNYKVIGLSTVCLYLYICITAGYEWRFFGCGVQITQPY